MHHQCMDCGQIGRNLNKALHKDLHRTISVFNLAVISFPAKALKRDNKFIALTVIRARSLMENCMNEDD